jgi:hypothetical protein
MASTIGVFTDPPQKFGVRKPVFRPSLVPLEMCCTARPKLSEWSRSSQKFQGLVKQDLWKI